MNIINMKGHNSIYIYQRTMKGLWEKNIGKLIKRGKLMNDQKGPLQMVSEHNPTILCVGAYADFKEITKNKQRDLNLLA